MKRRNKDRWKRGSSAVEFALALPVFILLVIGIIEFGWYFFVQHTLQYATREGMRLALVGRQLTDPQGNVMTREASIIKTIRDQASLAVDPGALMISIYKVDPGNNYANPPGWQSQQAAGDEGDYMRVRVYYEHVIFTPLIGKFVNNGYFLVAAEGTYRNELFK
jgi:hypothetical protein